MSKAVFYYILIAAVLVGKIGLTLYTKSLVVHHGVSMRQYQVEQKKLAQQKAALTAQIARTRSIAEIKNSALATNFQPILKTVTITSTQSLASVQ